MDLARIDIDAGIQRPPLVLPTMQRGPLNRGELRPTVDAVFPISEGRQAFERLANGSQFGKIVLGINEL